MNEDCTCEDYPNLDCPRHGMYTEDERVDLFTLAMYHPRFGETPVEREMLRQRKEREIQLRRLKF